jgi:hypothetical protein
MTLAIILIKQYGLGIFHDEYIIFLMSAINLNGGPVKGKCIYQYRAVKSEGST